METLLTLNLIYGIAAIAICGLAYWGLPKLIKLALTDEKSDE